MPHVGALTSPSEDWMTTPSPVRMRANVLVTRPAPETADKRRTSTPPILGLSGPLDVSAETSDSARLYFMQYFRPDPASVRQLTLQRSGFAWTRYACRAKQIARPHLHPVPAKYVTIDDIVDSFARRPARQSVHSPAAIVQMPTDVITNMPVDPIVSAERVILDEFSKGQRRDWFRRVEKWGRPGRVGRPRTRVPGGGLRANGEAVSVSS